MSHYKVLGVSREASKASIRMAYIDKAKRFHPDVNQSPQAEERFIAIQEAYQVLSDDFKRKRFDSSSSSSPNGFAASASASSSSSSASHGDSSPTPKHYGPRYKGKVYYDPAQERADFSREFYEQAEALRKEMENDKSSATVAISAKKIITRLFWKSIPLFLIPSFGLIAYNSYKESNLYSKEKSPILHDMYGRAYIADRFGRRVRAPRYDDKSRLSQWNTYKTSDKSLLLGLSNAPEAAARTVAASGDPANSNNVVAFSHTPHSNMSFDRDGSHHHYDYGRSNVDNYGDGDDQKNKSYKLNNKEIFYYNDDKENSLLSGKERASTSISFSALNQISRRSSSSSNSHNNHMSDNNNTNSSSSSNEGYFEHNNSRSIIPLSIRPVIHVASTAAAAAAGGGGVAMNCGESMSTSPT